MTTKIDTQSSLVGALVARQHNHHLEVRGDCRGAQKKQHARDDAHDPEATVSSLGYYVQIY